MAELTLRGERFHVQRLGVPIEEQPRIVLFVHGLVMDNLASWYFTSATSVAQHAHVILMDLRGHGRSSRPKTGYSISSLVEDMAGVLDACGAHAAITIVGNSFGGLLATAFALRYPDRVSGLVLVEAHLSDQSFGDEMAATLLLTGEARDQAIATHFSTWLGRHSQRKANRLAMNARALVYDTSLIRDLQSSPPFTEAELRSLRAPTLALYGERSDIRGKGDRLSALLPNCELQELAECSHSILWEATDDVTNAIVGFVTSNQPPEAA